MKCVNGLVWLGSMARVCRINDCSAVHKRVTGSFDGNGQRTKYVRRVISSSRVNREKTRQAILLKLERIRE